MKFWLDIRVPSDELAAAVTVLAVDVDRMEIDLAPPAAGPEVELSVYGRLADLQVMPNRLQRAGVTVLAERTREWAR